MDEQERQSLSGLLAILLAGILFLLVGFIAARLFMQPFLASVLVSFGISCLSALLVFVCQRLYPRPEQRIRLIRGHEKLYKEYQKTIEKLSDDAPHTVWTIASLPPSPETARRWDNFLCGFLEANEGVDYHRVVVLREGDDNWQRRLKQIKSQYAGLLGRNYYHYETEGPPSIECLMVDGKRGFVTFAASWESKESVGIFVDNAQIWRELERYFQLLRKECRQITTWSGS